MEVLLCIIFFLFFIKNMIDIDLTHSQHARNMVHNIVYCIKVLLQDFTFK